MAKIIKKQFKPLTETRRLTPKDNETVHGESQAFGFIISELLDAPLNQTLILFSHCPKVTTKHQLSLILEFYQMLGSLYVLWKWKKKARDPGYEHFFSISFGWISCHMFGFIRPHLLAVSCPSVSY